MNGLHENVKVSWRVSSYFMILLLSLFFVVPIFKETGILALTAIPFFIFIGIVEVMIRLTYNNYKYELTKDAVKIEKGVITKIYKSIPYGRIQNVDIRRGILPRMLGYSTVMIHTAGYSTPGQYGQAEGVLPGVAKEDAEKIRDYIISQAKK